MGSYILSARTVRNAAAVDPKCANTGFCWPEDPCGKTDVRIVHASLNRVKVKWLFVHLITLIALGIGADRAEKATR